MLLNQLLITHAPLLKALHIE